MTSCVLVFSASSEFPSQLSTHVQPVQKRDMPAQHTAATVEDTSYSPMQLTRQCYLWQKRNVLHTAHEAVKQSTPIRCQPSPNAARKALF
jgi:hypothetical protein